MLSHANNHRHGLIPLEVQLLDFPAVVARIHFQPDFSFVINHRAICPDVIEFVIRMFEDNGASRPDEPCRIIFMMLGHRKFEDVNLFAAQHIFQNRSLRHLSWRYEANRI